MSSPLGEGLPRELLEALEVVLATPDHVAEARAVLHRAHTTGLQAGAEREHRAIAAYIDRASAELEETFEALDAGGVRTVEEGFESAEPSAIVAAYYGGAAAVLHNIRSLLRGVPTPSLARPRETNA